MTPFERLVEAKIILTPATFTPVDIALINKLGPAEVAALISIRATVGDNFIKQKTAGPAPSMAIVF